MKTLTLRVDDEVYNMFKLAADGAKRNLSNFIEYATLQYLISSQYVDNEKMKEILEDEILMKSIKQGISKAKNGDYEIV